MKNLSFVTKKILSTRRWAFGYLVLGLCLLIYMIMYIMPAAGHHDPAAFITLHGIVTGLMIFMIVAEIRHFFDAYWTYPLHYRKLTKNNYYVKVDFESSSDRGVYTVIASAMCLAFMVLHDQIDSNWKSILGIWVLFVLSHVLLLVKTKTNMLTKRQTFIINYTIAFKSKTQAISGKIGFRVLVLKGLSEDEIRDINQSLLDLYIKEVAADSAELEEIIP